MSADEFSRGIRAARWALNPKFDITTDILGVWLPFEKYLNGLALIIWPDVILTPRMTVFIASCLLLIVLFLLTNYLFNNFWVAALASLFIIFQPWYVWLSGTPMLEMYYFGFFFAGLLVIIMWLKEERGFGWLWAGLCLFAASGFHVQSWTLINFVNLLTLPVLFQFYRQKKYANLSKLFAFYMLSNGFIITYGLVEFINSGEIFGFLTSHTTYSKWYYNGYEVSISEKLFYYPRVLIQQSSTVMWIGLVMAVVFFSRVQERLWKLFPLFLAVVALGFNSLMNVFSGPPSAAPGRYSFFYTIILSIYLAYGAYHLFGWGWKQLHRLIRYPAALFSIVVFLYGIQWGINRIPAFPQGMSQDSVKVGQELDILLNQNPGVYMVELAYWDFLAVNLTSLHFDDIVYDRERNTYNRNTPSLFLQDDESICLDLMQQNVKYVVLKDSDLKTAVQQTEFLALKQEVGPWAIYEMMSQGTCKGG